MLQCFVPVGILRLVQGNQIYYIFYEFIFLLCVLFVLVVVDLKSHVFEIKMQFQEFPDGFTHSSPQNFNSPGKSLLLYGYNV